MLRLNLFNYRDLVKWLHDPFGHPNSTPDSMQVARFWTAGCGLNKIWGTWFWENDYSSPKSPKYRVSILNSVLFWTAMIQF